MLQAVASTLVDWDYYARLLSLDNLPLFFRKFANFSHCALAYFPLSTSLITAPISSPGNIPRVSKSLARPVLPIFRAPSLDKGVRAYVMELSQKSTRH